MLLEEHLKYVMIFYVSRGYITTTTMICSFYIWEILTAGMKDYCEMSSGQAGRCR